MWPATTQDLLAEGDFTLPASFDLIGKGEKVGEVFIHRQSIQVGLH
jgi:hypothetical protein